MDNLQKMIESNEKVIGYFVIGCIALAGLNCIERPDYNFFLYLFIYYTMIKKHKFQPEAKYITNERMFITFTLIVSFVIDFLWIMIYKNKNVKLSILLSWIEIIIKIPIFAIVFVMWIGNNKTVNLQNNPHFDKLDEEE